MRKYIAQLTQVLALSTLFAFGLTSCDGPTQAGSGDGGVSRWCALKSDSTIITCCSAVAPSGFLLSGRTDTGAICRTGPTCTYVDPKGCLPTQRLRVCSAVFPSDWTVVSTERDVIQCKPEAPIPITDNISIIQKIR